MTIALPVVLGKPTILYTGFSVPNQQIFRAALLKMFNRDSEYQQAAEELRKAMKGAGTDEMVLAAVAARFSAEEREIIAQKYVGTYGDPLEKHLKVELTGNMEKLMTGMFAGRWTKWAQYLHDALKGAGTKEDLLIEMIFLMNDEAQKLVQDEYRKQYNSDLGKDIEKDISLGHWAKLIRSWLSATNDSGAPAEQIAEQLYKASKGAGTDELVFMNVLANCHPKVYREACEVYQKKYGKTLEKVIKAEFTGKSEDAYLAAHYTLYDYPTAVARYLKAAFKGAGTDEALLVRMTVLFSDKVNGAELKKAYQPFGDVVKDMKRDLTGKFEKAVMAMWQLA